MINIKKYLPYLLVSLGTIGELFSLLIMNEKYKLALDSFYVPPCSINSVVSCVTVMKTWQASVFGFPNPILGIGGFAVIMTIGVALLAGASFRRWFWLGTQAGVTFAVSFIYWLFFQSVYEIGALCPFCMVVWSVTIPIFLYVTVYNITEGHISASQKVRAALQQYHLIILAVLYLVIISSIIMRFVK